MNKNLWLKVSGTALMLIASGCLKEDVAPNVAIDAGADVRTALIKFLDNQASSLVTGINKVIIEGKFMQNMNLQNPPQPIQLGADNDFNKVINYLLAQQSVQGNSYTYKPDSKICSEILAVNNPSICIEAMKQVTLTQTPTTSTEGLLEIAIGDAKPFYISYTESAVIARAKLGEIVKAAGVIDQVMKQNGDVGFSGSLPTTHEGEVELTAATFMTVANLRLAITSAVDLKGQNENGPYSLQIAKADAVANLTFDSLSGIAQATVNLPSVMGEAVMYNQLNETHNVKLNFPGLSGALTLDNSLESIVLEAIKLTTPDIYFEVDGLAATHVFSASQLDAQIQSYVGGDKTVSFAGEFSVQAIVAANAIINGSGEINLTIAQATELFFKPTSEQAKVLAGSVQLLGTDSFMGMMDAQAGSCIKGQQNSPIPLQTAVCQ